MKKIRSIQQLQAEKRRIKLQQLQLEQQIRDNWAGLKESLKPMNLAGDVLSSVMKNKSALLPGGTLLQSTVAFGAGLLARKFAGKAGEKLVNLFKKK